MCTSNIFYMKTASYQWELEVNSTFEQQQHDVPDLGFKRRASDRRTKPNSFIPLSY